MKKIIIFNHVILSQRRRISFMRCFISFSMTLCVIFTCCCLYSEEIKISDTDIALMKLEKSIADIQNSIAGIKETVKSSVDASTVLTERITKLEEETAALKKSFEEISALRLQIDKLGKSREDTETELKKNFGNKIKANEDEITIILGDIYRLKEDIISGRKPAVSVKRPFKEYIPYIALGVSVVSLFVAVH